MTKEERKDAKLKAKQEIKAQIHNLQLQMRQAYAKNDTSKAADIMNQIKELRMKL